MGGERGRPKCLLCGKLSEAFAKFFICKLVAINKDFAKGAGATNCELSHVWVCHASLTRRQAQVTPNANQVQFLSAPKQPRRVK